MISVLILAYSVAVLSGQVTALPNSCICVLDSGSSDKCNVTKMDQLIWIEETLKISASNIDFDTFVSSCAKEKSRVIKKHYFSDNINIVVLEWATDHYFYYDAHNNTANDLSDRLASSRLVGVLQYRKVLESVKRTQGTIKAECQKTIDTYLCNLLIKKYEHILAAHH